MTLTDKKEEGKKAAGKAEDKKGKKDDKKDRPEQEMVS